MPTSLLECLEAKLVEQPPAELVVLRGKVATSIADAAMPKIEPELIQDYSSTFGEIISDVTKEETTRRFGEDALSVRRDELFTVAHDVVSAAIEIEGKNIIETTEQVSNPDLTRRKRLANRFRKFIAKEVLLEEPPTDSLQRIALDTLTENLGYRNLQRGSIAEAKDLAAITQQTVVETFPDCIEQLSTTISTGKYYDNY